MTRLSRCESGRPNTTITQTGTDLSIPPQTGIRRSSDTCGGKLDLWFSFIQDGLTFRPNRTKQAWKQLRLPVVSVFWINTTQTVKSKHSCERAPVVVSVSPATRAASGRDGTLKQCDVCGVMSARLSEGATESHGAVRCALVVLPAGWVCRRAADSDRGRPGESLTRHPGTQEKHSSVGFSSQVT